MDLRWPRRADVCLLVVQRPRYGSQPRPSSSRSRCGPYPRVASPHRRCARGARCIAVAVGERPGRGALIGQPFARARRKVTHLWPARHVGRVAAMAVRAAVLTIVVAPLFVQAAAVGEGRRHRGGRMQQNDQPNGLRPQRESVFHDWYGASTHRASSGTVCAEDEMRRWVHSFGGHAVEEPAG